MIENKVCNDDFTIADPFLEILDWEKNKDNRFNITMIVGLLYYITVGMIYYIRFILLHNATYGISSFVN